MPQLKRAVFTAVLAAAGSVAVPVIAAAQTAGDGFLFGTPRASFTLRGGWAAASAHSDLFDFTTSSLTIDRGDFSSPTIGADLAIRVVGRTHFVLSTEFSGMDKRSEFRHFIDNNDAPIEQVTTYRRVPLTLSVKQYVTPTGRSIGRFAWIPTRAAAYVGAGGGVEYYKFRQTGDFIDFQSLDVFHSLYVSEGWTSLAHALAGVDYSLNPRFALTTEGKYAWSSAELSRDFSGFQRLDLSGFSATVGLSVRF